jgi:3-deoxy-manno-octulosonate cytidylyltransferase (CMP-KDO synthetase)
MKCLAVIPARYASTRFPGKPLVDILGKSMIRRVYEQVSKATEIDEIVVATDNELIFNHVLTFGGKVVITRADHPTGTDRCAEVAAQFQGTEIVLNVQGDEPFLQAQQLDQLVSFLKRNTQFQITTMAKKLTEVSQVFNPHVVKVVFGKFSQALYFSRNAIPAVRGAETANSPNVAEYFKHIGLYAFRRNTLLQLSQLAQSPLEKAESLEQLRWLENGYSIGVVLTERETTGIDTPEDLARLLHQYPGSIV